MNPTNSIPYFTLREKNLDLKSEDFFWLVGILEGEGTFVGAPPTRPNTPLVALSMSDKDIVDKVAMLLRVGTWKCKQHGKGTKPMYRCRIESGRAVRLMLDLYPFMGNRRQIQITKALTTWDAERNLHRGRTKLNLQSVYRIKSRILEDDSALAKEYGVSKKTIRRIKYNERWHGVTV